MDGGLGANVDAAGGFIDDEEAAAPGEPFGDDDFLLISAGHIFDGGVEGGGFDAEALEIVGGLRAFLGMAEEAEEAEALEEGEGEIFAATHHEDESLAFAVFGDEADAAAHGFTDAAEFEGFTFENDFTFSAFVEAEEGFSDLAATRADEAGETDDFTGADGERDVAEFTGAGEIFDVEKEGAVGIGGVLREVVGDGAADHHLDDLILSTCGPRVGGDVFAERADIFSVAEDADGVAEPEDFGHAMGDVDHGDAALLENFDEG